MTTAADSILIAAGVEQTHRYGYFFAVRRSDNARCRVWCYDDAHGNPCVGCGRTGRPVTPSDFIFIAPDRWPVTTPLDFA